MANDLRPTPRNASEALRPVTASTALCCTLYILVPVLCVFAWGEKCMLGEGNVLFMVPASNGWVTFWSFMLVVVITLLYPVINLLVVKEFETVIALLVTSEVPGTPACRAQLNVMKADKNAPLRSWMLCYRHQIITIVAAAVVILLDTLVNDLASLFGLCGSLGMSTVSMILPPLMFLYSPGSQDHASWHKVTAAAVCLLGMAILFGSTGSILKGILT
ncbi:hypothetical protein CYMTET_8634 [Cymbomonas tetramitiformis]|uniref:Amino acid transporter transmembrane domain-containing protein n=1 Tax=Cymbomonas tetramitiformis TaxID=36881 RepID=A0AAE0LFW9_9CHLO|nr:hypothetical protein CYMTET_8634 [Cymbomonas tetramitiformis]